MLPIASIIRDVKQDSRLSAEKIVFQLAAHAYTDPVPHIKDRKLAEKLEKKICRLLSDAHFIPYFARSNFFANLSPVFYEPLLPLAKKIIDQADADTIFERIMVVYDNDLTPLSDYWMLNTAIKNSFTLKQFKDLNLTFECMTDKLWDNLLIAAVGTGNTGALDFLNETVPHLNWKNILCSAMGGTFHGFNACINHIWSKYTFESEDVADLLKLSVKHRRHHVTDAVLPHYKPSHKEVFEILNISMATQNYMVFKYLFDSAQDTDVSEMLHIVHKRKDGWSLSIVDEIVAQRQKEKLRNEVSNLGHTILRKM